MKWFYDLLAINAFWNILNFIKISQQKKNLSDKRGLLEINNWINNMEMIDTVLV